MIEYGGGINQGPAGQVGGGGATPDFGSSPDFFSTVGHAVNDAAAFITAQPTEVLVAAFVVLFLGFAILRRAF